MAYFYVNVWHLGRGLTERLQIKYRSSRFGVANEAGFDTKHESMLVTTEKLIRLSGSSFRLLLFQGGGEVRLYVCTTPE